MGEAPRPDGPEERPESAPPWAAPVPPAYGPPAYGPPPVGQPHPAPGYGPPPTGPHLGQPYPMPVARPRTGVLSWALGFLVFLPIPFLGALVSGIAMAIPVGSASRRGGLEAANARSAANWGITFALVSTMLIVAHFVLLFALTGGGRGGLQGFFPFGTIITVYFAVCVLHVVLVIVGTVRSSQARPMRVPFAIPFIRG